MSDRAIQSFADDRLRVHWGRVATIELHATERKNAVSRAMWAAFPDICAAIAADERVRAVILMAAEDPVSPIFSAGADIGEFDTVYATPERTAEYNGLARLAQAALRDLPRPVIARITGACVGGGCGLALACDLRFAADTARFGITPARLGLGYSYDDTAQLVEKVGPARAKDMLFSGRLVPAEEALAIGLVERVFPAGRLAAETLAYAEGLAELSPVAIRTSKRLVNVLTAPSPEGREAVRAMVEATFAGADFAEGRAAFRERRRPRFPGEL